MAENKVKFGLKNVHYAVRTSGGAGTVKSVPGAVNLSLSPQGDTNKFYADNRISGAKLCTLQTRLCMSCQAQSLQCSTWASRSKVTSRKDSSGSMHVPQHVRTSVPLPSQNPRKSRRKQSRSHPARCPTAW